MVTLMGTYTMVVLYPCFTCSASAASPPRFTGTVAWSVTNTILTRWDTNSWGKIPTDGNVSRCLHWLSWFLVTSDWGGSSQEKGGPRRNEGGETSYFACFVLSTVEWLWYLTAFKTSTDDQPISPMSSTHEVYSRGLLSATFRPFG